MPAKMRKTSTRSRVASASYARAVRLGTPADQSAARSALNEAKVQEWIENTLAEAPPHLSDQTIAQLSRLLTTDSGEGK